MKLKTLLTKPVWCTPFGSPGPGGLEKRNVEFWGFLGAVLLTTTILALRQPSQLLNPHLAYEDGSVFFAQAFNLQTIDAIIQVYAGYWHLLPRLIAEIGTLLPFTVVPLFYTVSALVVSALCASWFVLPHFRHIVADDRLRFGFAILIVCLPRLDGLMLIAYLQWFVALWAALVSLMVFPRKAWQQYALAAAYMVAIYTAPSLVILTPIWMLRWYCADRTRTRLWIVAIIAVTLLMVWQVSNILHSGSFALADAPTAVLDLVHAIVYQVIGVTSVGLPAAGWFIAKGGWITVYLLASAWLAVIAFSVARTDEPGRRIQAAIVAYISLASAALYLRRAGYYGFRYLDATGSLGIGGERYFFVSAAMFLILALMQVDTWQTYRPPLRRWLRFAPLLLLLAYIPTFHMAPWHTEAPWSTYAGLLSSLAAPVGLNGRAFDVDSGEAIMVPLPEAVAAKYPVTDLRYGNVPRPDYLAGAMPLNIPAASAGDRWPITLFVDERAGLHDFPEGVRLLGAEQALEESQLLVTLFWEGEPVYNAERGDAYTAYVHLVDGSGQRIAGFDVLLKPENSQRAWEDITTSRHPLAVPASTASGTYDLAIGLYRFEDGKPVPGSGIRLAGAVSLP